MKKFIVNKPNKDDPNVVIKAQYFRISENGDLIFYSSREYGAEGWEQIPIASFSSGNWCSVIENDEDY